MRLFGIWMIAILPGSLVLTSCASSGNVSAGAGYALLTPSPATASYIVNNDRTFAEQTSQHNRKCRQDAGCGK